MSTIQNTSDAMKNDPSESAAFLLSGLATGNATAFIEQQERAGQAQLVNSDRLPTKRYGEPAEYVALGFTFDEPDPCDSLFCAATLPPGWSRQASGHDMWSHLVDEHGRRRVDVFYKAAFYDRKAHMRLNPPSQYVAEQMHEAKPIVTDDVWLTVERAIVELAAYADQCAKDADDATRWAAQDDGDYWTKQATEHRVRRDAALERRDQFQTQLATAALTPDDPSLPGAVSA